MPIQSQHLQAVPLEKVFLWTTISNHLAREWRKLAGLAGQTSRRGRASWTPAFSFGDLQVCSEVGHRSRTHAGEAYNMVRPQHGDLERHALGHLPETKYFFITVVTRRH